MHKGLLLGLVSSMLWRVLIGLSRASRAHSSRRTSWNDYATSSLLLLGIDQSSDRLLVMAPGIISLQMLIDGESIMKPKVW